MGQAKARGSKDQRVAESIERKAALDKASHELYLKRQAELDARALAITEQRNKERLERGEQPVARPMRTGGRRTGLNSLLAVAALSMMAK